MGGTKLIITLEMRQNLPCGLMVQRDLIKSFTTDLELFLTLSLGNDVKLAVSEINITINLKSTEKKL